MEKYIQKNNFLWTWAFVAAFVCSAIGQGLQGQSVVINELMALNDSLVADEAGEYNDWIELFNLTDDDIDLEGYFLTDDPEDLNKWSFHGESVIPANGYLIVWADKDSMQGNLHADFKLSSMGETVILLDTDLIEVDMVTFGQQEPDRSYARSPNGTGNFEIRGATFESDNDGTVTGIEDVLDITLDQAIDVYPNPAKNVVTIDNETNVEMSIAIYDMLGRVVWENTVRKSVILHIDDWTKGVYFIKTKFGTQRLMVVD